MAPQQQLALFIDAENAPPKYAKQILEHCEPLGRIMVARCFGRLPALKTWEKAMTEHHISPVMTPPWADKANASDFTLVIDMVSLLHVKPVDLAVIVSSDADFSQLAVFIREQGVGVHGMGEAKTAPATRKAYDTFVVLGTPAAKKPAPRAAAVKAAPAPRAAPKSVSRPAPAKPRGTILPIDNERVLGVFKTLAGDARSVSLQAFGRALAKDYPSYKKGHRTFNNFLAKLDMFEVRDGMVLLKQGDSSRG
jgi:hypothetical protein